MLVLSRKLGEKIYIGDNICITVVDIDRGKIRLGIQAPREVPVYREELLPIKGATTTVPGPTVVASGEPPTSSEKPQEILPPDDGSVET